MEVSIEAALALEETKHFLATARRFCTLIEEGTKTDVDFLLQLQVELLNLYQSALALPYISLTPREEQSKPVSKGTSEEIINSISKRLGANRFYWDIFDPTTDDDLEPGAGDLLDDVGDIYQDLKYNLATYSVGTLVNMESALWEAKFGFEKHWGQHAVGAIRTIHFILTKN